MKKSLNILCAVIIWLGVIPAIISLAIMGLWNSFVPEVCGFAAINFTQAASIFFLGQFATAGFIAGLFVLGSMIHKFAGHHRRHSMREHWGHMTPEQREQYFRRSRDFFRKDTPATDDNAVN